MKHFAFISRHVPTQEQLEMARDHGIEMTHVGDRDAFAFKFDDELSGYDGFIVVHPVLALSLINRKTVGIFENGNRAPEGERPQFYPKALHLFHLYNPNDGPVMTFFKDGSSAVA